MDYKKKYKDALEKAKKNECLENIFPELKESEDERIREALIYFIKQGEIKGTIRTYLGVTEKEMLAWLEKQGEKESDPRYENLEEILAADDIYQMSMNDEMVQEAKEKADNALSGMCIGRLLGLEKQYVQKPIISSNALREGIAHFGITQYQIDNWLKKYVDVEKQSEQRLFDNIKPKFKVGDWCIDNEDNTIFQITKVLSNLYYYRTNEGKEYSCTRDSIERDAHLRTIQDAKDGDVFVAEIDEEPNDFIYIFKEYNQNLGFWSHCYLDAYTNKFHEGIYHNNLNVGVPATKEQRDMFFQKMHEAGYEWDFEVKKLNKIEKKPACSEKEKQLLLKDLCARLPYKVRCKCVSGLGGGETEKGVLKYVGNCYGVISNYYEGVPLHSGFVNNVFYPIENIKPYLRPMSSMTDEEFQKLRSICPHSTINKTNVTGWFVGINGSDYGRISRIDEISKFIDWLNAHHFDFRGLIEKGLALEAPEGMYNS